ncbi:MAG: hypothetical protein J0I49_09850 [Pseudonocardia sp.]|uniref:hypothetical protein n=1 Tax=Pseudonocardia sp. TaxID=60912 RepID=UPI001AD39FCC|nr:hypothetical protein [Pseudonocardia sp.]MBN9098396.1 hypothetical protein [Pseudonocardia sp.]
MPSTPLLLGVPPVVPPLPPELPPPVVPPVPEPPPVEPVGLPVPLLFAGVPVEGAFAVVPGFAAPSELPASALGNATGTQDDGAPAPASRPPVLAAGEIATVGVLPASAVPSRMPWPA